MDLKAKIEELLKGADPQDTSLTMDERMAFLIGSMAFAFVQESLSKDPAHFLAKVKETRKNFQLVIDVDVDFMRDLLMQVLGIDASDQELVEERMKGSS